MIAHVHGQIIEKNTTSLIIDVGGLGYEIQVTAGDLDLVKMGSQVKFYTYDHLRENAHELFGFSQLAAKRLFELLISVSGVGPKMALAILGLGEAELIRSAIANSDSAFVQRASGVGRRLADRIVVDLKDKVGLAGAITAEPQAINRDDALDGLLSLGYNLQQANEVLKSIDPSLPAEARIKLALRAMA